MTDSCDNEWWLTIPITDAWLRLYIEGTEVSDEQDLPGLLEVLDLAAGHDPTLYHDEGPVRVMESPTIHPNNLIVALCHEVLRLRDIVEKLTDGEELIGRMDIL